MPPAPDPTPHLPDHIAEFQVFAEGSRFVGVHATPAMASPATTEPATPDEAAEAPSPEPKPRRRSGGEA